MWLSFSFKASPDQQEILIALLDSIGFEGFEQSENELVAFTPSEKFSEKDFLETIQPFSLSFEKREMEEENWNKQWEKNFQSIVIGNKIAVRASFHEPIKNVEHEIVIDPKMSFGTGHHATTEMMMRLMLEENFSGKTVLDFGCGTGILSILASKLGAASVFAIDNDEWAVENCRENFLLNGIPNAEVILKDSIPANKKFDFILANVTRTVITEMAPHFNGVILPKGKLLISGFLDQEKSIMKSQTERNSLSWSKDISSGEWLAAVLIKN